MTASPMNAVRIECLNGDTTSQACVIDLGPDTLKGLYREINCQYVDVVQLAPDLTMWVDDEGMIKNDAVVNLVATVIARAFGFDVQSYYGTVVFTGGADEEGETQPISPDRAAQLAKWTAEIMEQRAEAERQFTDDERT